MGETENRSLRFSWIEEDDSDEEDYPIEIDCSLAILPQGLERSLKMNPDCVGNLQYVQSSIYFAATKLAKWKTRYWELRGHFLFYYSKIEDLVENKKPRGAINLHRIDRISFHHNNLVLVYRRTKLQLKNVSIYSEDASTQYWYELVNKHIPAQAQIKDLSNQEKAKQEEEEEEEELSSSASQTNSDWNEEKGLEMKSMNKELKTKNNSFSIQQHQQPLPPTFVWMLQKSGIQTWKNRKWIKWRIRFSYYVLNCFLVITWLYSFVPKLISGCSHSINLNRDGKPPCLKVIAIHLPPLLGGISALIIYTWLLRNINTNSSLLLKTHRRRMYYRTEKYAKLCRSYIYFSAIIFTWIILIDGDTTIHQNNIFILIILYVLIIIFAIFFIVIIQLPFVIFSMVNYSEGRRLRLLIKDFYKILTIKPFCYAQVSKSYLELVGEFENTNLRFGPISSLMVGISISIIVLYSIQLLYSHFKFISIFNLINTFTLGGIIIYTMLKVNYRCEEINTEVTKLLATLQSPNQGSPSSSSSSSYCTMVRPRSEEIQCVDAMKLAVLVKRAPCEMRLLGRKFTEYDIYKVLLFLITVQFLDFVGLQDAIG